MRNVLDNPSAPKPVTGSNFSIDVDGVLTLSADPSDMELSDLTDVNTSTATDKYVLVADGTDWESRLLVEADISDLGTYLTAETDPIVGAITGLVKADGAGVIAAATAGTDYAEVGTAGTWTANQTLNDDVELQFGTGSDVTLTWDAADLVITGIPANDPTKAGALWNNNGVLSISVGT